MSDTTPVPGPLTVPELVRRQLDGQVEALSRYDQILWRIRTGYVLVLYGLISLLTGTESKMIGALGSGPLLARLFWISLGISFCAFIIDMAFLLSKLRVVAARNRLGELALVMANGPGLDAEQMKELPVLLHLAGEEARLPPVRLLLGGAWSLPFLYATTPAVLYGLAR